MDAGVGFRSRALAALVLLTLFVSLVGLLTGIGRPLRVCYSNGDWRLSRWKAPSRTLRIHDHQARLIGLADVVGTGLRPLVSLDIPDPAARQALCYALEPLDFSLANLPPEPRAALVAAGEVLEVYDGTARLNLGRRYGLEVGMRFESEDGTVLQIAVVGTDSSLAQVCGMLARGTRVARLEESSSAHGTEGTPTSAGCGSFKPGRDPTKDLEEHGSQKRDGSSPPRGQLEPL